MFRRCSIALRLKPIAAAVGVVAGFSLASVSADPVPVPAPITTATPAPTPAPSVTPIVAADSKRLVDRISAEERAKAAALWSTAMEKFSAREFKGAVKLLEEYVNRYPGTPDSVDARYDLAQSYLYTKRPDSAIPLFLSVIEIRGNSLLGNEARTYLGQSYLDAGKFTEAYLVSDELLAQSDLPPTFRAKALLIRAHAQAGLGQNLEAEKTLVAFQSVAENDPELERETATSFLVSLLLRSNRCDALPSAKALPEDQLLDQMERKGICILEMATMLSRAAKKLGPSEISQAAGTLVSSVEAYRRECSDPGLARGRLSKSKYSAAKKEITEKLADGCRNAEKLLRETFRGRENLKAVLEQLNPKEKSK
jgi:TolA-binding protein